MLKASPAHLLGGAALITTTITTILNGICYGLSRTSAPQTSSAEAATVTLSIASCTVVLALILFFANTSVPLKSWNAATYGVGIAYLLLAAAATAGTTAWSALHSVAQAGDSNHTSRHGQRPLLIARCIVWAISVLTQGMLCGVLFTGSTAASSDRHTQWPTLISYELNEVSPSRDSMQKGACDTIASVTDSQRPSLDTIIPAQPSVSRATSSRSASVYSDKTLTQSDISRSPTFRPESAASASTYTSNQEPSRLQHFQPKPQRHSTQIKRSLDSVMLRPSSTFSALEPARTKAKRIPSSLKLKYPHESNIHPLFRSCSLSPPPTASPTSMVLASPEAGQTIDKRELQRMRSSREIRPRSSWRRSPLFQQTDHLFEDRPDENRPVSVLSCR